jgi:hypothetical protein
MADASLPSLSPSAAAASAHGSHDRRRPRRGRSRIAPSDSTSDSPSSSASASDSDSDANAVAVAATVADADAAVSPSDRHRRLQLQKSPSASTAPLTVGTRTPHTSLVVDGDGRVDDHGDHHGSRAPDDSGEESRHPLPAKRVRTQHHAAVSSVQSASSIDHDMSSNSSSHSAAASPAPPGKAGEGARPRGTGFRRHLRRVDSSGEEDGEEALLSSALDSSSAADGHTAGTRPRRSAAQLAETRILIDSVQYRRAEMQSHQPLAHHSTESSSMAADSQIASAPRRKAAIAYSLQESAGDTVQQQNSSRAQRQHPDATELSTQRGELSDELDSGDDALARPKTRSERAHVEIAKSAQRRARDAQGRAKLASTLLLSDSDDDGVPNMNQLARRKASVPMRSSAEDPAHVRRPKSLESQTAGDSHSRGRGYHGKAAHGSDSTAGKSVRESTAASHSDGGRDGDWLGHNDSLSDTSDADGDDSAHSDYGTGDRRGRHGGGPDGDDVEDVRSYTVADGAEAGFDEDLEENEDGDGDESSGSASTDDTVDSEESGLRTSTKSRMLGHRMISSDESSGEEQRKRQSHKKLQQPQQRQQQQQQRVPPLKLHRDSTDRRDTPRGAKPTATEAGRQSQAKVAVRSKTVPQRIHVRGQNGASEGWSVSEEAFLSLTVEEMQDVDDAHDQCGVCRRDGEGDVLVCCSLCPRSFHIRCLIPKVTAVPSGYWACPTCDPNALFRSRNFTNTSRELFHMDNCAVCRKGDAELQCRSCPMVMHRACADPAVAVGVGGQEWSCSACESDFAPVAQILAVRESRSPVHRYPEYFCKFAGFSYLHCSWVPGLALRLRHTIMCNNFRKKLLDAANDPGEIVSLFEPRSGPMSASPMRPVFDTSASDASNAGLEEEIDGDDGEKERDAGSRDPLTNRAIPWGDLHRASIPAESTSVERIVTHRLAHQRVGMSRYDEVVRKSDEGYALKLSAVEENGHRETAGISDGSALIGEVRPAVHYLVKWRGLQYSECTWEPRYLVKMIAGEALRQYESRLKQAPVPIRKASMGGAARRASGIRSYKSDPMFVKRLGLSLHAYQLEGLNWIRHNWVQQRSCILADEMGLGKTIQTATFLSSLFEEQLCSGPFLVIVPLSTLHNWGRELAMWAPGMNTVLYSGSYVSREAVRTMELWGLQRAPAGRFTHASVAGLKEMKNPSKSFRAHVVVVAESSLNADLSFFQSYHWPVVVVDEAHRLKSGKGPFYRFMEKVSSDFRCVMECV